MFGSGFIRQLQRYYIHAAKPISVALNLTARCNQRCIFCEIGQGLTNTKPKDEISSSDVFRLIDEMDEIGTKNLCIGGGEPFVRKDIWEILEYSCKRHIKTSIMSNGMVIRKFSRNQKDIIKKAVTSVSISLDSAIEKEHDKIRGVEGAFMSAIEGIDILKSLGVNVTILSVIIKDNYQGIPHLIRLAKKLNVNRLSIQPLIYISNYPTVSPIKNKSSLLVPKEDIPALKEVLKNSDKLCQDLGMSSNCEILRIWIEPYLLYANTNEFFFDHLVKKFKCISPFLYATIDYEGRLLPCSMLPPTDNILKKGLLSAWEDGTKTLRRAIKRGKFPVVCRGCVCEFPSNLRFTIATSPIGNISNLKLLDLEKRFK